MSLLDSLRVDIGDDVSASGASSTSEKSTIVFLRADIGDDTNVTGGALPQISCSLVTDFRADVADEVFTLPGVVSGDCSLVGLLRVDVGDDGEGTSPPGPSIPSQPPIEICNFVCGPETSTDGAVTVFDNTEGNRIRETSVIIDANGNITTPGGICLGGFQAWGFREVTDPGSVSVLDSDTVILVNKTVGQITSVSLPGNSKSGRILIIKDKKGDAFTNNISLTPASGSIDGFSSFVMSQNFQSISVIFHDDSWHIV